MNKVTSDSNYCDSLYTFQEFSKEWDCLAARIRILSDKILATKTGRIQFEEQLDKINFEKMSLASRTQVLSSKDLKTAQAMMDSMEKVLTVLDNALYKPTLNSSEELAKMLMSNFFNGVVAGAAYCVVGHVLNSLTVPTPEPTSVPLDSGTDLAMSRFPGIDIHINVEININNGDGGNAGSGGTSGGNTSGTESNSGKNTNSLFFA